MVRRLGPLLVALLMLALPAAAKAAGEAPTALIVKRERGAGAADIRAGAGVRLVRRLGLPRTELVRARDPRAALRALQADPDVVYAVPNLRGHAAAEDPLLAEQWGIHAIDAPEAWPASQGGANVVAVVDGSIDRTHVDFAQDTFRAGEDYLPNPAAAPDEHATHVAGIVAADRGNDQGGSGVAPNARVMPLRVLNESDVGTLDDVLAAFHDGPAAGARVVSASLTFDPEPRDEAALAAAFYDVIADHRDTLYVVAAGNEGNDNDAEPSFPCNAPAANLVCVGASDQFDAPAAISNFGNKSVDLFAPGVGILSTLPGDRYGTMTGTSMATPHVAGVAVLVRSLEALDGAHLRNLLLRTTDANDLLSSKSVAGGRVSARRAVLALDDTADADQDGWTDVLDNCRTTHNPQQGDMDFDGGGDPCDGDTDGDGRANTVDRCPTVFGTGADGCVPPPPPPDRDRDGVADANDPCPDVAGSAGGCPPPPPPPPDSDGDGRLDAQDACPGEPAGTASGCPIPSLETFTASVVGRRARVRVEADRAATVLFKIERRRCTDAGCRWRRVVRETAVAPTGGVTLKLSGLQVGRYRATVRVSSPDGASPFARERFRIRP